MMRAAYLGPPGTNSHAALSAAPGEWEPVPFASIGAVIGAVQEGQVEAGLVPVENSREGAVAATLDALVFDAPDVLIVGERFHRVSYCLVAAEQIAPDEIRTVLSHPQATGQCARFLREQLPGAIAAAAASTADAVKAVAERGAVPGDPPHAAIGTYHAARLYGARILVQGIEDDAENTTRFAWIERRGQRRPDVGAEHAGSAARLGPARAEPVTARAGSGIAAPSTSAKTVLVFWGAGDRVPGWLVDCLAEFASRGVNLTRIESRPRRVGLGQYVFICDLAGSADSAAVTDAIAGLRERCEAVRVLGSFPAGS